MNYENSLTNEIAGNEQPIEEATQKEPQRPAVPQSVENQAMSAVQAELDMQLWDIRLAAILNTMEISRRHGEHRDWTAENAAQIRAMLGIVNKTVMRNGDAVLPDGFGPLINSPVAATIITQAKQTS
jgi:hypothetical protein